MLRVFLPVTLLTAFAAGGCYSDAGVGYTGGYYTSGPSLAYVAPGVQVVADYDYPVFFSDGFYWRWYGNTWYRSPYWDRGWAISYNVPYSVRGISRPWAYTHYRPGVYGGVRGGVEVRDHRGYAPNGGYYRGGGTYRGGTYRGPAARPAPVRRGPVRQAPARDRDRRRRY